MEKPGKNKRAAVYFSSGIGDALLLTPLIKQLKADGFHVTGVFTSPFHVHEMYEHCELPDENIVVLSKPRLVWFITRFSFKKFDVSYVNYFAASKANLAAASRTSRIVHTNKKVAFSYDVPNNIIEHEIEPGIHDGLQNLLLYKQDVQIDIEDFHFPLHSVEVKKFVLPEKYIVLQVGAGNNETPYKIWDTVHWEKVISEIQKAHKDITIILLGDKNELKLGESLRGNNIMNLTGQTTLQEAVAIIKKADCLIGSDSGLMHVAVALNVPTFSVWGASNENLYSYNKLEPIRNQIIFNKSISCRPCSSWHSANTSRVNDPNTCPDFACLKTLNAEEVAGPLLAFLGKYISYAE